jgi:hypothetical protein
MRAHGVPDFPDPLPAGQASTVPSGINPMSSAFQRAQNECYELIRHRIAKS